MAYPKPHLGGARQGSTWIEDAGGSALCRGDDFAPQRHGAPDGTIGGPTIGRDTRSSQKIVLERNEQFGGAGRLGGASAKAFGHAGHFASSGKQGRIEIEYYGNDDLQRIIAALGLPSEG